MRASVVSNWLKYNEPNEGVLAFMYTDAHQPPIVTTAMGNALESVGAATTLPWRLPAHPSNAYGLAGAASESDPLADEGTVAEQWLAVLNGPPNSSVNAGPLSTVRLSPSGIQQAVDTALTSNETILRRYFPGWDNMPADAQCAIMSKAWAMGPGFPAQFPTFTELVNAGKFKEAIDAGHYHGVGTQNRQAQEDACLANADAVQNGVGDPATLYWPGTVSGGPWTWFANVPWKLVLALGGAGALAAGPLGAAAGVAAAFGGKAIAPHVTPHLTPIMARVKTAAAKVRGKA